MSVTLKANEMLTIGEVASQIGVHVGTIRR